MTLAPEAPARTEGTATASRDDCMKFYATGRTAEGLRAKVADPMILEGMAILAGVQIPVMRQEMLALADGIDLITAEGLTAEQCYFLLGLDRVLGPFAGPVPTQRAPSEAFAGSAK
jgi:hypothetical protein